MSFKKFLIENPMIGDVDASSSYAPLNYAATQSNVYNGVVSNTDGTNLASRAYNLHGRPTDPMVYHKTGIPLSQKIGKIIQIETNRDPILIVLSDGTRFYLDNYRYRSLGKPKKGNTLRITLQKRPEDKSLNAFRVDKVEVLI
jgi:hypothetical protein